MNIPDRFGGEQRRHHHHRGFFATAGATGVAAATIEIDISDAGLGVT
jgi:hypothetical protein